MQTINYSAEPLARLYSWLPPGLAAETAVFLPDACPGKSPLPTGCAVHTHNPDWRRFAVSDCGCGMQLLRSSLAYADFRPAAWDALGVALRQRKGQLGDLGGGNHFLDALASYESDRLYFLIHTGSRAESGLVDQHVDAPGRFETEFARVVAWARANRDTVAAEVERQFGPCERVLDMAHNTFELQADGSVIIRKGAIRILPGQLAVLPSSMSGDVVLVRAAEGVRDALYSLSHGTGRTMSRGDARALSANYDFGRLRRSIYIPDYIADESLRTEAPYCYRSLDDCLALLGGLVCEVERFAVVAYLGHL
jgi:tRNA-splicing ligase RtcB